MSWVGWEEAAGKSVVPSGQVAFSQRQGKLDLPSGFRDAEGGQVPWDMPKQRREGEVAPAASVGVQGEPAYWLPAVQLPICTMVGTGSALPPRAV